MENLWSGLDKAVVSDGQKEKYVIAAAAVDCMVGHSKLSPD